MEDLFYQYFYRTATLTAIIAFATGAFIYRTLSKDLKVLLALLGASFLFEVFAFYYGYILKQPNVQLFRVYTIIEFTFLVVMLYLWQTKPAMKKLLLWILPVFLLIWAIANITTTEPTHFDSLVLTVESIIVVAIAVYALAELLREATNLLIYYPRFWVISSLIIYFSGNILVFAIGTMFLSGEAGKILWAIHTMLNIVHNLCFAWAFICHKKYSSELSLSQSSF